MIPHVLACVPAYGGTDPDPLMALIVASQETGRAEQRRDYEVRWMVGGPKVPIAKVRNTACHVATKGGATHLFFVDNDMLIAAKLLGHLLALDLPIVVPMFFRSGGPVDPLCFDFDQKGNAVPMQNYPVNQVFKAPAGAGTGCMLIKVEVLQALEAPWFRPAHEPPYNYDLPFCQRAARAGFYTYCDSRMLVQQMGNAQPVGRDQFNMRISQAMDFHQELPMNLKELNLDQTGIDDPLTATPRPTGQSSGPVVTTPGDNYTSIREKEFEYPDAKGGTK